MIEKHLRQAVSELVQTDSDSKHMTAYLEMTKTRGWKVYQGVLMAILQAMGNDFFSKEFTNRKTEEKDMTQRVYREVHEIIKMLINPMKYGELGIKIQAHNRNMSQRKEQKSGRRPETSN